jgi:hypothetical protein
MKEELLHYIWQFQLFDKSKLFTEEGKALNIIRVGNLNRESGPDFLQAQIKIDEMMWFGAVEIHLEASDWNTHHHQYDDAYDNVILHVVWSSKRQVYRKDGSPLPTLKLSERVNPLILSRYTTLLEGFRHKKLACGRYLSSVPEIQKMMAMEKSAVSRLDKKCQEIVLRHKAHEQDWQQTAFHTICRSFGFKANAQAMDHLGAMLPFVAIQKEHSFFDSVFSLLFNLGGMLDEKIVKAEKLNLGHAEHLMRKYRLQHSRMEKRSFKWAPLRPANFPDVRLFQLAVLLFHRQQLTSFLLETNSIEEFASYFAEINSFIKKHQWLNRKVSAIGKDSIYSLLINSVIPFRYAYGKHLSDEGLQESALELWQKIPAEQNRYTRLFTENHFQIKSAFDSQACIQQYQSLCEKHQCLQCPVGASIMKNHDLVVT